jgi:serine/threonine protein phosphatase PrpC
MTTNKMHPSTDDDDDTISAIRRRAVLSQAPPARDFRPSSARVTLDVAARSECGATRTSNDDHYLVVRLGRSQETLTTSLSGTDIPAAFEEHGYAMLVADGIGEAGAGSVASRVAISTVAHLALENGRWNLRVNPDTAMEIMARAELLYGRADAEVFARSRAGAALAGISTSLTAAYSAGDSLFIAHVGHSRAYRFRNGALTQLSRDQTMAGHLASAKRPVAVERSAQDLQHILTDALGAGGSAPTVDVDQFDLLNGDVIMLCTNGLTDVIDDARIADVLALPRQPAEQCHILTDLALQARTEDNVTVVLGQYRVPA